MSRLCDRPHLFDPQPFFYLQPCTRHFSKVKGAMATSATPDPTVGVSQCPSSTHSVSQPKPYLTAIFSLANADSHSAVVSAAQILDPTSAHRTGVEL